MGGGGKRTWANGVWYLVVAWAAWVEMLLIAGFVAEEGAEVSGGKCEGLGCACVTLALVVLEDSPCSLGQRSSLPGYPPEASGSGALECRPF